MYVYVIKYSQIYGPFADDIFLGLFFNARSKMSSGMFIHNLEFIKITTFISSTTASPHKRPMHGIFMMI